LRQNLRHHDEREREREERKRRPHHQAGLSRCRVYDGHGNYSVDHAQQEVEHGETPYSPEDSKGFERSAHDGVDNRDPSPNAGADKYAEDDALAQRTVTSWCQATSLGPGLDTHNMAPRTACFDTHVDCSNG